MSGHTYGNIIQANAGGRGGFIVKYSKSGELKWSFQLGTSKHDVIFNVALDTERNIYLISNTRDSLGNGGYAGGYDCFVGKLNHERELLWLKQFGTAGDEFGSKIVLNKDNNIYACGYTNGQLGTKQFGGADAYVIKLSSQGNV